MRCSCVLYLSYHLPSISIIIIMIIMYSASAWAVLSSSDYVLWKTFIGRSSRIYWAGIDDFESTPKTATFVCPVLSICTCVNVFGIEKLKFFTSFIFSNTDHYAWTSFMYKRMLQYRFQLLTYNSLFNLVFHTAASLWL